MKRSGYILLGLILVLATFANGSDIIYETDFEGYPPGSFPFDWTKTGFGAPPYTWGIQNWFPMTEFLSGSFMSIGDPGYLFSMESNEELICPSQDCSGYIKVTLEFGYEYYSDSTYNFARVDISVDGGGELAEFVRIL